MKTETKERNVTKEHGEEVTEGRRNIGTKEHKDEETQVLTHREKEQRDEATQRKGNTGMKV